MAPQICCSWDSDHRTVAIIRPASTWIRLIGSTDTAGMVAEQKNNSPSIALLCDRITGSPLMSSMRSRTNDSMSSSYCPWRAVSGCDAVAWAWGHGMPQHFRFIWTGMLGRRSNPKTCPGNLDMPLLYWLCNALSYYQTLTLLYACIRLYYMRFFAINMCLRR